MSEDTIERLESKNQGLPEEVEGLPDALRRGNRRRDERSGPASQLCARKSGLSP
jgi:hypothetical protein